MVASKNPKVWPNDHHDLHVQRAKQGWEHHRRRNGQTAKAPVKATTKPVKSGKRGAAETMTSKGRSTRDTYLSGAGSLETAIVVNEREARLLRTLDRRAAALRVRMRAAKTPEAKRQAERDLAAVQRQLRRVTYDAPQVRAGLVTQQKRRAQRKQRGGK